jgi:TM2 domain-containing membrane protein YozV
MELDNLMLKSQLDARELMLLEMELKRQGREMVIAYAFWFFLGAFGAHRFYIGRTGSAVAQLVLSITIVGMINFFNTLKISKVVRLYTLL